MKQQTLFNVSDFTNSDALKSNVIKISSSNYIIDCGAVFSECKKYRYTLWRVWDNKLPLAMFIGLNPSTANEKNNDPTIRRVMNLAYGWGYGGIYMLNCFPYISTNPKLLEEFGNNELNDNYLLEISRQCKDVFFAWGNFKIVKDKNRDKELTEMFPNAKALKINKNGSPQHPLYVPKNTNSVKWKL